MHFGVPSHDVMSFLEALESIYVPASASRGRILASIRLLNEIVTLDIIPGGEIAHGHVSTHDVISSLKASGSMRVPSTASHGQFSPLYAY